MRIVLILAASMMLSGCITIVVKVGWDNRTQVGVSDFDKNDIETTNPEITNEVTLPSTAVIPRK